MEWMNSQFAVLSSIGTFTATSSLTEDGAASAIHWTWPPLVVIALLMTALFYGLGVGEMLRRSGASYLLVLPILWFALGWISLVIALDSPLHELGEQLFWVHMTQHEILMLVSSPLLVLGRPLVPFLWALSPAMA